MQTRTRYLLLLLCLMIVLGAAAEEISAQSMKIGIVRDARIEQEYKAFQRAKEEYDIAYQEWEEKAGELQQQLADMLEEYERQKLILSDEKKAEKEAAIEGKQGELDAYTKRIFGPGGQAYQKHDQLLQPLVELIRQAIEAVSVEGNYDIVFTDQSGIGYIKEYDDITDDVLQYLAEIE